MMNKTGNASALVKLLAREIRGKKSMLQRRPQWVRTGARLGLHLFCLKLSPSQDPSDLVGSLLSVYSA